MTAKLASNINLLILNLIEQPARKYEANFQIVGYAKIPEIAFHLMSNNGGP